MSHPVSDRVNYESGDVTPRTSIGFLRLNKLQKLKKKKTKKELVAKNEKYEQLCLKLQKDVEYLKKKKQINKQNESFGTDEDEFQMEIGRFDKPTENSQD